jgi:oligopeptide transport system substrate-binding protein
MHYDLRSWFAYAVLLGLVLATVWAARVESEAPADFTFANNTEVKSLDPTLVTGQPEGRILVGLFEGLVNLDPKTLQPVPGIAQSWDLSDDRLTYTFHIRPEAKWSDGSAITAHDVAWSLQRFLDPQTAAQYSYQGWYIKNAERYSTKKFGVGDRVEVELRERPSGARPFARGQLLHGKLVNKEPLNPNDEDGPQIYTVEIDGKKRRFSSADDLPKGVEPCAQVVLDFSEVGVKALDDATLQITLTSPTPYFTSLLAFYPLYPVQPKCVETYGSPMWTKPEHIVTSGPFNLHSRRIRDRIRLKRSDTYWDRENVACDTIDALAVESNTTAFNLYLTGKVDWITSIPPSIVPILLAEKRPDFQPVPELTVYFYRLNTRKPPLNDKRVRQALAMSVDKHAIVNTITRAGELPAECFVPPGLPGYVSPIGLPYDPGKAKQLLAEAGYDDPGKLPPIPILYNTDEGHQSIAELIQDQWKRSLGIRVTPQNQPWGAYLAAQRTGDYTVSRAGWGGDYLDPNTFLDLFVTDGANNETGWSNAEYDRLIAEAAKEFDETKRLELFRQAEAILLDEVPIIPIYFRVSKNMVRPYVGGFFNNPLDMHPLKHITVDEAAKNELLQSLGVPPFERDLPKSTDGGKP